MSNGQQSTLENVYSYSFTANNLFQISLVRDTDANRPSYKRQFFCFLTLAPGQKTDTGRTYNFTNKINMKQDVHNVMSLAHALRAVARGQKALIGNFSLFTDSSKSGYGGAGGSVKQVFVNEYLKQPQNQQQGQQGTGERFVSLGFRIGNEKPIGLMFGVPDAMACADVLEFIGKMGLKLDANGSTPTSFSKPPQQQGGQPQGRPQQYPQSGGQQYPQSGPPQGGPPPSGPPPSGSGHPNTQNNPDNVAQGFQQGLNNAAGGPPNMEDDIPF